MSEIEEIKSRRIQESSQTIDSNATKQAKSANTTAKDYVKKVCRQNALQR